MEPDLIPLCINNTKPLPLVTLATSLTLLVSPFALAQQKSAEAAKRQIPTTEKSVKAAADLTMEAITSANKIAHKRALAAFEQRKQYMEKVAKGEIVVNEFLLKDLPKAKANLPSISSLYAKVLEEKDAAKKVKLTDAFLIALQPFGPFLEAADHKNDNPTLSQTQLAEYNRLEAERKEALVNPDKEQIALSYLNRQETYTMLHLATPIVVIGKPHAEVFFEVNAGGVFSNGLNRIKAKADDKGIAQVRWISHGFAVGESVIYASSSSSPEVAYHVVEVVQPKLRKLISIEEAKQKQKQFAKTIEKLKSSKPLKPAVKKDRQ